MKTKIISNLIAMAVCVLSFTTLGIAQQATPPEAPPEVPPIEISDEEMEQAATAYTKITEINNEFQQSLQKEQDPEKRQGLQMEANKKFAQAIHEEGLEVDQYNAIMQHVSQTEDLSVEFGKLVKSLQ